MVFHAFLQISKQKENNMQSKINVIFRNLKYCILIHSSAPNKKAGPEGEKNKNTLVLTLQKEACENQ